MFIYPSEIMRSVALSNELSLSVVDASANISDLITGDKNCTHGIQWIYKYFGECAMDKRMIASVAFGIIAIIAWILNGLPQMILNCTRGIPDKAVSPYLLFFWVLGDTFNLVGGIFTDQLFLQLVVAGYCIFSDFVLIFQYVYCLVRRKRLAKSKENPDVSGLQHSGGPMEVSGAGMSSTRSSVVLPLCCLGLFSVSVGGLSIGSFGDMSLGGAGQSSSHDQMYHHMASRSLLQATVPPAKDDIPFFPSEKAYFGYVLGWVSSVMYFCSRLPQLYKNWRRKTTEGLSYGLFILACLGNLSYGLQIFLSTTELIVILRSLPWILGSIGVLILDFCILCQFFHYRENSSEFQITPRPSQTNLNATEDEFGDQTTVPILSAQKLN